MTLIRRRDGKPLHAQILRPAGEASLPTLLIDGEPFPPDETAGYYLHGASTIELAALRRGGYALLRSVGRAS